MSVIISYLETFLFFFAAFVLGPLFVAGWIPLLIAGIVLNRRGKGRLGVVLAVIGGIWGIAIITAVWVGARSCPAVPQV